MRISISILVLFVTFTQVSFGQLNFKEKGYPKTKYFSPKTYNALSQNFSVEEDNRGIIHFGNNGGVLTYDGVHFKFLETENQGVIRSISKHFNDVLFLGGNNEIGYLGVDSIGNLTFKSLNYPNIDTIDFGDVWRTHMYSNGVYFQSDFYIFNYDLNADTISIIETKELLRGSFVANDNLYVVLENIGIRRLMDGIFVPIPFGEKLKEKEIAGMVPIEKDNILLCTTKGELFKIIRNSYGNELSLEKFPTQVDDILSKNEIVHFGSAGKVGFSISTKGSGVFIISKKGDLVQIINEKTGLEELFVNHTFLNSKEDLWLAHGNGISKVEFSNPISTFPKESGLVGIIEDICRYKGEIFCATDVGVYKLPSISRNKEGSENLQPNFELLSNFQCWDLLPVSIAGKKMLLGAFNDGVYEVKDNGEIVMIAENYPWKLHQSLQDSSIIYIGLAPGLGFIKYEEDKWLVGNEDYDFPDIRNFCEVNDIVWAGSSRDGLVFGLKNIEIEGDTQLVYNLIEIKDSTKILPQSSVFTGEFNGHALFGVDSAIFTYDENFGGFKLFEKQQDALPGKRYFHRLLNQDNEKLWAITVSPDDEFEFGYFDALNNFEWVSNPFKIMTDGIIHSIYIDSGGVAWLGGTEGLYRYDPKIEKDFSRPFKTHIRRVEVNRTTTIFGGAFYVDTIGIVDFQPEHMMPTLEHEQNHLTFEFAAFAESDPEKHEYQYRLIGLEEEWSPPTNEPKAVYTNLEPGEYTFEVKSTNIYDVTSPPSTYNFSITPPWYETPWYYGGQFGFIGLLVFFTIYLNRSKRDSEYTAIVTFIGLITVFEFFLFLLEPYVEDWFGGVPIFQLIANIILAISLNPVEYWVRGVLKKPKGTSKVNSEE